MCPKCGRQSWIKSFVRLSQPVFSKCFCSCFPPLLSVALCPCGRMGFWLVSAQKIKKLLLVTTATGSATTPVHRRLLEEPIRVEKRLENRTMWNATLVTELQVPVAAWANSNLSCALAVNHISLFSDQCEQLRFGLLIWLYIWPLSNRTDQRLDIILNDWC